MIPFVIAQHAEEVAHLWIARRVLVSNGYVRLSEIARLDERLHAHFDGVAVAGPHAEPMLLESPENPSEAEVFRFAVLKLQAGQADSLRTLLERCGSSVAVIDGLAAALLWVSRKSLQGIVAKWLVSSDPVQRRNGLEACAAHGVDPDLIAGGFLADPNPWVRSLALRAAGTLGKVEAMRACLDGIEADDPMIAVPAAESAVLLGDRNRGLAALVASAEAGIFRSPAQRLALQAMNANAAHAMLKHVAADPAQLPRLIQGSGIAGDPIYAPWLIEQMRDDTSARLAGEAFTLITGADLREAQIDRPHPEDFESGPTDNPDDDVVDMDADEGLPWPDVEKVEKWWSANAHRFHKGTRYFMGAPVTREHCIDVLKNGYQRQRILAAHYLCLLNPGTPLFNTSAPAWRQQRLVGRM